VIRPANWAPLVLGLLVIPLTGAAQTSRVITRADTTLVTRTLGELRMTLMLTPSPSVPGDSAAVIVRMENLGADSARIMMYPCYRVFHGVRFYWVGHEVVCQAASYEGWLAPGAVYTTGDTLQVIDRPGQYELEYLAVAQPRVFLTVPIVLGGAAEVR
jgi:hypothetical protein